MPDHYGKLPREWLAKGLQWIKDNPQYTPAYQTGLSLGNAEFLADILPYMDMDEMHLVDPSKAMLKDTDRPLNLAGINTIGVAEPQVFSVKDYQGQPQPDLEFDPGYVWAVHASNARPELYAHEFRHESPRAKTKMSPGTHGEEERWVRKEDLYHAFKFGNNASQERARFLLADMLYSDADDKARKSMPSSYWYEEADRVAPEIIKAMEVDHSERGWLPTSPIKK